MFRAGQLEHQPSQINVLVRDTLCRVTLLEVLAYFNVGHEAEAGKASSSRGVLTTATGLGLVGIGGGGSDRVQLTAFSLVKSRAIVFPYQIELSVT